MNYEESVFSPPSPDLQLAVLSYERRRRLTQYKREKGRELTERYKKMDIKTSGTAHLFLKIFLQYIKVS